MNQIRLRMMMAVVACSLFAGSVLAADGRLRAANGIVFEEFRGYESWPAVAPSKPADGLKMVLGNPIMIESYRSGFPGNGSFVPDGAVLVKIAWSEKKSDTAPAPTNVPDALRRIQFMVKDSKRFPTTGGWGYAQFNYDSKTKTFSVFGSEASFVNACHDCHTRVKARDFVFTDFPTR
jgi:hypothetical protein